MSPSTKKSCLVLEETAGQRLDQFLEKSVESLSRSAAKTLIQDGCVWVNGAVHSKVAYKTHIGDRIEVTIPEPQKLDLTPQDLKLDILFEDEHLAVLNKPVGISVHPSQTEFAPTLVHGLLFQLSSLSKVGGVERPGIVHRIDKGTSGILVVSKTDQAHQHLSSQFKAHSIARKYKALCFGELRKKLHKNSGKIVTAFGRNPKDRKKMTGKFNMTSLSTGQEKIMRKAITHWKILGSIPGFTLVECALETGRTHQIRVHLSELGFPVVGDPLYVDHLRRVRSFEDELAVPVLTALREIEHQLLHAYYLEFVHPNSGNAMKFETELPEDFANILKLLGIAQNARQEIE